MENGENKTSEGLDAIKELGAVKVEGRECGIFCLSIIGQIEGHYSLDSTQKVTKYDHLLPLLAELEESPKVDGVLILLNTLGGDVEAGLAISEMIAGMTKPTASIVLGGGHSIGVPLAVSARRSFIVQSATMTVHPVRVSGTVVGSPQTYFYFEKMQNRIVSFVCNHSKISPDKFKSLMLETEQIATDTGSVIDGGEAVEFGLIDSVGGLSEALACLEELIKQDKSACNGDSCAI